MLSKTIEGVINYQNEPQISERQRIFLEGYLKALYDVSKCYNSIEEQEKDFFIYKPNEYSFCQN